jgi:hypothetical protein
MNEEAPLIDGTDFRQIKTIFWITCVIALGTFFCPFIENKIRWEIYWKIIELYVLGERALNLRLGFVLFLIIATLVWLPIMGYAFYRYTVQKRFYTIKQRLVNYFLFGIGLTVYILPLYAFFDKKLSIDKLDFLEWGYWLLLVCMTIMFVCYLKIQKVQLVENNLSDHLIMDDEN